MKDVPTFKQYHEQHTQRKHYNLSEPEVIEEILPALGMAAAAAGKGALMAGKAGLAGAKAAGQLAAKGLAKGAQVAQTAVQKGTQMAGNVAKKGVQAAQTAAQKVGSVANQAGQTINNVANAASDVANAVTNLPNGAQNVEEPQQPDVADQQIATLQQKDIDALASDPQTDITQLVGAGEITPDDAKKVLDKKIKDVTAIKNSL